MSVVKQQHYVPKLHLRQWADANDVLAAFDIVEQRRFESSVRSVGGEKWFYHERGENQALERSLGVIEGEARALVKKILDTDSVIALSRAETEKLQQLVMLFDVRTKQSRALQTEVWQAGMDFITESVDIHDWRLVRNAHVEREDHGEKIEAALKRPDLMKHLRPRLLMRSSAPWFTTGDHPVIRRNPNVPLAQQGNALGSKSPGVQFLMPVSPTRCVLLCDRRDYPSIVGREEATAEETIYIRDLILWESHRYVFSTPADDFSIEKARLALTPELGEADKVRVTSRRVQTDQGPAVNVRRVREPPPRTGSM